MKTTPQFLEHRLSQSTMAHILSYATHLRVTCEFEKGFLSNPDYNRGKVADLDLKGPCIAFEQINIRGVECLNSCQAKYWVNFRAHANILSASGENCPCPNCPNWIGGYSEHSFGGYFYHSTDHRCTQNNQATRQWWLGVNNNALG